MLNNEFAQKVIMLRGMLGLTQEEFAEKINVSKRSVSAWENGDSIPKKTVRINMAVICGLPVSELLLDEEKPQNAPPSTPKTTDEDELLSSLKKIIENSNTEKETKDKYMDAIYRTFNMKERN